MKVITDFSHWTIRLGLLLAFAGVLGWKIMSCSEVETRAKADMMQATCPQELKTIREQWDKRESVWTEKFSTQESSWKEKCDNKERYSCSQCSSQKDLVEKQLDTCQDELKDSKKLVASNQTQWEAWANNVKKAHVEEIQKLVSSLKAACPSDNVKLEQTIPSVEPAPAAEKKQ